MFFVTYNDTPTGIYFSQVTDVCRFLNSEFKANIRLIAFISIRNFFSNRNKIKNEFSDAFVFPMFPKLQFWKFNIISLAILTLFHSDKRVIARGPFATGLCLILKRIGIFTKVIFDARGAYTAELNEYNVVKSEKLKREIHSLENNALNKSDFRIAISQKLTDYWINEFNYKNEHVIIPCTLHRDFDTPLPEKEKLIALRKKYSFRENEIVITFSGSSSQWHSFSSVDNFFCNVLSKNENIFALILSDEVKDLKCFNLFPKRVKKMWLQPAHVREALLVADYGILLREKSITNKVASPVKFAEYLSCGLNIFISDSIGDYSRFVKDNNCGTVVQDLNQNFSFSNIPYEEKKRLSELAREKFSKNNFRKEYEKLLKI